MSLDHFSSTFGVKNLNFLQGVSTVWLLLPWRGKNANVQTAFNATKTFTKEQENVKHGFSGTPIFVNPSTTTG